MLGAIFVFYFNLNLNIMNKLYQCPYDKAVRCSLTDCCLGCETRAESMSFNSKAYSQDAMNTKDLSTMIMTVWFALMLISSVVLIIVFAFLGQTQNLLIANAFMWIGFIGYRTS